MDAHFEFIGHTLGRYRIVEQIGAGGMGVVYRAQDCQLERIVAVKVLPVGTLADEAARKLFRNEALALAKLNHPNIETVHDFGSQDGVDFLVMELIPGSPLSTKLAAGPLSEREVVRLGMQLAEGLAAAHSQRVIHRDLKPGNLMITPDGRLKILDFGLAKLLHSTQELEQTQSITSGTGAISGTVPYMAPEQLRGEAVDARSDIYAAGAVLYEMATGRRPFPQTHGPTLIGAILHETVTPPRSVNPHISPGLENVVSKSIEREPSQRYQSAGELSVALEGLYVGTSREVLDRVRAAPPRISRIAIIASIVAVAAVIIVGLGIGLNFHGREDGTLDRHPYNPANNPASLSVPVRARRSVAVLGLKNVSGQADKAWLATALAEILTTELGAGEELRTVASENVAQMKVDLSLPDADSYGPETLAKVRENLNADEVVVGSYIPLGKEQIRLDLRLQDTLAGETLASVSAKGREDQIDDIVSRAGAELREKLGVGAVTASDAAAVRATLPSSPEAARLYSQGLIKLRAKDSLAACDLFEKSIALEPRFAPAHSALAAAWGNLGYDQKGRAEAKVALDLSGNLGREDKLAIEGRYREAIRDWENAIAVYRTLSQFFPDNLEYGLRLAFAQNSAGKYKDAVATLQQLRRLAAPLSDDPRIDLEEANSYFLLSNWKDMGVASVLAAKKARASGARLILARALECQGVSFRYLGEFDKADAAFRESERTFAGAGDRWGAAVATMGLGASLQERGDLNGARLLYEQSLLVFREVGSQKSVATSMGNIAMTFYDQGDLGAAEKMYEEALPIQRAIGDKYEIANLLNSIANVLADKGDQAGARRKYQEALAMFRETGSQFDAAMTMGNMGELFLDEGNLPEAKDMFERALVIKRSVHNPHSEAYTLSVLGELLTYEGDLKAARKAHEEALAIRTQLGEKGTAAEDSLALARITFEEGRLDDALAAARTATAEFQTLKQIDYEVSAHELAALCLLQSSKVADAEAEIGQAATLLAKSDNRGSRLLVAIAAARVATASGEFADARRRLDAALAEATTANLLYYQYDSRLALGELEIKSGKTAAGHARLAALEKESRHKGFLLVARKAAVAAKA